MRRGVLVIAFGLGCRPGPSTEDGAPNDEAKAGAVDDPAGESKREPTPVSPGASTSQASTTTAGPTSPEPDPLTVSASRSTSVGTCTEGRLEGGLPLPLTAAGLLFHPDKDPGSRFGTVELVGGLVRAAAVVERAQPGVPLTVSDLSREGGGEISRHASHRSGRDVDVLFYLRRERGEPFVPAKAIPLDPEGRGTDYGDLADPSDDIPVRIDLPRTWAFVAALLADDTVQIQQIYVVEHVRAMLLAQGEQAKADPAILARFGDVTCQPRFPHDDHMHIRVFCTAEDIAGGCNDVAPIFPWQRALLKSQGAAPVAPPKRKTAKPKLTSVEEAREKAGPMDAAVTEFLDRRRAWAKPPHPGRRWCK